MTLSRGKPDPCRGELETPWQLLLVYTEGSMPANQAKIEQIISLMEATDTDLIHVLFEVFSHWDDEAVLALLPPSRLHAALI